MMEISAGPDTRRLGVCYWCMYGEHTRCYGHTNRTKCFCNILLHDLKGAKAGLGQDPDRDPPHFPEDPSATDRFYFLPGDQRDVE